MVVMFYKTLISLFKEYHLDLNDNGSVALLLRNAKCNVNPGLSHFERCVLACTGLLADLHLHFSFRQIKAKDSMHNNFSARKQTKAYVCM